MPLYNGPRDRRAPAAPAPAPRIPVEDDARRWTQRALFSSGYAYEMNCRIQKAAFESEMERDLRHGHQG